MARPAWTAGTAFKTLAGTSPPPVRSGRPPRAVGASTTIVGTAAAIVAAAIASTAAERPLKALARIAADARRVSRKFFAGSRRAARTLRGERVSPGSRMMSFFRKGRYAQRRNQRILDETSPATARSVGSCPCVPSVMFAAVQGPVHALPSCFHAVRAPHGARHFHAAASLRPQRDWRRGLLPLRRFLPRLAERLPWSGTLSLGLFARPLLLPRSPLLPRSKLPRKLLLLLLRLLRLRKSLRPPPSRRLPASSCLASTIPEARARSDRRSIH